MVLMETLMDYVTLVLQDVLLVMELIVITVCLVQVDTIYLMHNVTTHAQLDIMLMILTIPVSLVHIHVILVNQLILVTLVLMVTSYILEHVLIHAQKTSDIMVIQPKKNVKNVITLARPVSKQSKLTLTNVLTVHPTQIVLTEENVAPTVIVISQAQSVSTTP